MKYLTYIALITGTAFAQSITGVPVLKGALKTKTLVRGVQSTCKVKVAKVRNIMEEDAFGFPGYRVRLEIDVEARNDKNEIIVNIDRDVEVTNFWEENGKVVAKDLDYYAKDGTNLTIKPDGRLKSVAFDDNSGRITCSF